MRLGQLALCTSIALTLAVPALAATHPRRGTSSHKTLSRHAAKPKVVGQRTIDNDRATQIQEALIKAGYLSGTPSGHWDAETEAAMGKVQSDNGWQTRLVPDSRALIKLGLGPSTASLTPIQPDTVAQIQQ
jgi:peptidoglycan hydrolase-like protein with peptidoglycan-binding domain